MQAYSFFIFFLLLSSSLYSMEQLPPVTSSQKSIDHTRLVDDYYDCARELGTLTLESREKQKHTEFLTKLTNINSELLQYFGNNNEETNKLTWHLHVILNSAKYKTEKDWEEYYEHNKQSIMPALDAIELEKRALDKKNEELSTLVSTTREELKKIQTFLVQKIEEKKVVKSQLSAAIQAIGILNNTKQNNIKIIEQSKVKRESLIENIMTHITNLKAKKISVTDSSAVLENNNNIDKENAKVLKFQTELAAITTALLVAQKPRGALRSFIYNK